MDVRKPIVRLGTKTKNLHVRMTAEQLARIHDKASSEGKTASDYVREAALAHKEG